MQNKNYELVLYLFQKNSYNLRKNVTRKHVNIVLVRNTNIWEKHETFFYKLIRKGTFNMAFQRSFLRVIFSLYDSPSNQMIKLKSCASKVKSRLCSQNQDVSLTSNIPI